MGLSLAEKIIAAHTLSVDGGEVALKIDQTLTQDATGTMAYLEFEAIGIPVVRTERSVAYIDHNTLQNGFMNADDHAYIASVAKRSGVWLSRAGNGICHQVHLERFAIPGKTLIGSDSHTPTAGGVGCLAIGAGGLDVAVAMGGGAYCIPVPGIISVRLHGALSPYVSAKDVILEVLRILGVKGGVGRIIEYSGDGILSLGVPERATITNMGAELGATTSIFPSDEITRRFLASQEREKDYTPLCADPDAQYERIIDIDLTVLEPLAAAPHSPDNVVRVSELSDIKVTQCCIGSCTNSSYLDLAKTAKILRSKTVAEGVSLTLTPGSRQVFEQIARSGELADIIAAGARVLECACGPCIGMGQSPSSGGVSLRTFNRNFEGRSGTADAQVYLVSPETAAASALTGHITDPRTLGGDISVSVPERFIVNDSMIVPSDGGDTPVVRGPNIKPLPEARPLGERLSAEIVLKLGDNITTDHIMPAGAKILPYRSNIPYMSDYCFSGVDADFPARARAAKDGVIVAGANYGQGSSREHAALVPLYLGIRAVIAVGFARIHRANLINVGIAPLTLKNADELKYFTLGDRIEIEDISEAIASGSFKIRCAGRIIEAQCELSERQRGILSAGGLLNYTRSL